MKKNIYLPFVKSICLLLLLPALNNGMQSLRTSRTDRRRRTGHRPHRSEHKHRFITAIEAGSREWCRKQTPHPCRCRTSPPYHRGCLPEPYPLQTTDYLQRYNRCTTTERGNQHETPRTRLSVGNMGRLRSIDSDEDL